MNLESENTGSKLSSVDRSKVFKINREFVHICCINLGNPKLFRNEV